MLVINLFGAPGSGKSTGAAYIFAKLKMAGVNAELVTEFAKDKVWEENQEVFKNQAYIFGKQSFKMSRCKDKVDVIVTDSPLLLSAFYNDDLVLGASFNNTVLNVFNSYDNLNFFLNRVKPYNPVGRLQTEMGSDMIAKSLSLLLEKNHIDITYDSGDEQGYQNIINTVLMKLGLKECDTLGSD